MKKHKSVVAILLAVMMIFTMMPSMVFAAATWSDDYQKATNKDKVNLNISYTWTDGLLEATTVLDDSTYGAEVSSDGVGEHRWFYDLAGATLVAKDNNKYKTIPASMTADKYQELKGKLFIKLVRPDYTYAAGEQKNTPPAYVALVDGQKIGAYTIKFVETGFDATETTKDQQATISFARSTTTTTKVGEASTDANIVGDIPVLNVTVTAAKAKVGEAKFYFDAITANAGVGDGGALTALYDGAEHTVVSTPVEGYTVAYSVFNAKTGKYDAVDAVKVTDVDTALNVKAVYTKPATTETPKDEKIFNFTVGLTAVATPSFGFDMDGNRLPAKSGNYNVGAGVEVNPVDYVLVTPGTSTATDIQVKAVEEAAAKAAVKANEALLKEFFNDFFIIESSASKATPEKTTYTLRRKTVLELPVKDATALKEGKYAQLINNVGDPDKNANVEINVWSVDVNDFEVEFKNSPISKVFKGKKGKLAKAKTFKVKAVANNGATIAYKLINAPEKITINKNTGKITVKKGLKKGTYKFKVKAYVPGNSVDAAETQAVKVKIKK